MPHQADKAGKFVSSSNENDHVTDSLTFVLLAYGGLHGRSYVNNNHLTGEVPRMNFKNISDSGEIVLLYHPPAVPTIPSSSTVDAACPVRFMFVVLLLPQVTVC